VTLSSPAQPLEQIASSAVIAAVIACHMLSSPAGTRPGFELPVNEFDTAQANVIPFKSLDCVDLNTLRGEGEEHGEYRPCIPDP
jgi:hypothetical protein